MLKRNRNGFVPGRTVDKRDVETCKYVVRGTGRFPFDMLRRDKAWPQNETESFRLTPDDSSAEVRTIQLEGLAYPTVDRWRSFGWLVIRMDSEPFNDHT